MNHTIPQMSASSAAPGYAGDLTPRAAWDLLAAEAGAQLVDVRTSEEWASVGVPDLHSLGREVATLSWVLLPSRQTNPDFAEGIKALGVSSETPLLFLCRSGGRSAAAAYATTRAGYHRCYNIAGGFEGQDGWKSTQLPWKQV